MSDKKTYIMAFLPKANVPNANGFIYTQDAFDEMIKQTQDKIDNNRMVVCLDGSKNPLDLRDCIGVAKVVDAETNKIEIKLLQDNISEDLISRCDVGMIVSGRVDENNYVLLDGLNVIGCGLIPKVNSDEKEIEFNIDNKPVEAGNKIYKEFPIDLKIESNNDEND